MYSNNIEWAEMSDDSDVDQVREQLEPKDTSQQTTEKKPERIQLTHFLQKLQQQPYGPYTLYLTNVDHSIDYKDIQKHFKDIKMDKCYLLSKGIYQVDFDTLEEASKLLEIGNIFVGSRRILIKLNISEKSNKNHRNYPKDQDKKDSRHPRKDNGTPYQKQKYEKRTTNEFQEVKGNKYVDKQPRTMQAPFNRRKNSEEEGYADDGYQKNTIVKTEKEFKPIGFFKRENAEGKGQDVVFQNQESKKQSRNVFDILINE